MWSPFVSFPVERIARDGVVLVILNLAVCLFAGRAPVCAQDPPALSLDDPKYDKMRADSVEMNKELQIAKKEKERMERELYALNASGDQNKELVLELKKKNQDLEQELKASDDEVRQAREQIKQV